MGKRVKGLGLQVGKKGEGFIVGNKGGLMMGIRGKG